MDRCQVNVRKVRNLVIVRAGRSSLHKSWLATQPAERNWDMIVSSFEAPPYQNVSDETFIHISGGKWNGLHETFRQLPGLLEKYDYVWLPDDDLFIRSEAIDTLFNIMKEENLALAQPSLTLDSFYTYSTTLNCRLTRIRYTDLVELMAPCFSSTYLRKLLGLFKDTSTGWGMDWVWCRGQEDNRFKCAIIDAISVTHTRPIGGDLYKNAELRGENAPDTMTRFLKDFTIVPEDFSPSCYACKTTDGIRLGREATELLQGLSRFITAEHPRRGSSFAQRARIALDSYLASRRRVVRLETIDLSSLAR